MRAAMRMPHRMSAGGLAVASLIVLIPNLDWQFLADIPLPVVMVVAGSATLITLAVTMRMAVQRLTSGAAPKPNGSAGHNHPHREGRPQASVRKDVACRISEVVPARAH